MKTESLFILGGVAVLGYFVYKQFNKPITLSVTQAQDKLSNFVKASETPEYLSSPEKAVYVGENVSDRVFYQVKTGADEVTTYSFAEGDYEKLNWAQKFLLSTKLVPTKWVLG